MNTIPDIPRLFTAIAEWWACLIFIGLVMHRMEKWKIGIACIGFLVVQATFLMATKNVPLFFWIPCMAVAFLLMLLLVYCCCKISIIEAAYYAIQAFVIAEFCASIEWQVAQYFFAGRSIDSFCLQFLLLIIMYAGINTFIYWLLKNRLPKDGRMDLEKKDFFTAMIIGAAVFGVSNLSFITKNTPFSGQYSFEIANIRTLVDLAGIAMLYAHLVQCSQTKMRRELETIQNVLQNQYQQYKQSRESIDLINYKYHDLKHQIAVLRSEQDPDKRNAFLNQMEEEIKQYELQNKTGNHVLDTILTSKSLYCDKHGITLTSVADGSLLEFMDTMDICSIFGNALDNAIECELKIPDKEKRLIHVTVSQQKNFLMIRVENYFEGVLRQKEGSFATTKKEKQFHGYGIKSIKYTVDKYGGAVHIDAEKQWFDLKILIPLFEKRKQLDK